MADIRLFSDSGQLEMAAAEAIANLIRLAEGPCNVSLSGGSTPKPIFELLGSGNFARSIPWQKCHFFWGDERWVSHDHPDSNYRMAREMLLDKLSVSESQIHPVPTAGMGPEEAARQYERVIRKKVSGNKLPRFDLIMLGLGKDGHTASLFPGTRALDEDRRLVVASEVPGLQETRITFTPGLINAARAVMFIVTGEEKAGTLAEVLEGERRPRELPAQLVCPATGELTFWIDQAAGKFLHKSKRNEVK